MTKMQLRNLFLRSWQCSGHHKNDTHETPETLDTQRKNLQSIEIAGFSSWQGMRDSNPRKRSQSPVCYRYTNPLNGLLPKRMIIITISRKKSRLIFSFLQKLNRGETCSSGFLWENRTFLLISTPVFVRIGEFLIHDKENRLSFTCAARGFFPARRVKITALRLLRRG